jgi:phosphatidylglycerophosphate synthase
MIKEGFSIYKATRKKNDQIFNHYFMRVLAGYTVAVLARLPVTPNQITIFNLILALVACVMLVVMPSFEGGLWAILVLEISYLFDCCDGMLARHKKLASKTGHLFDFFTDEVKAAALVVGIGLRLSLTGGYAPIWEGGPKIGQASSTYFHLATLAGLFVITAAISLTKLQRHPDMSGKAQSVEAFYETVGNEGPRSLVARVAGSAFTFLRFLNHYPSHIYVFALLGRFDAFFFMYVGINGLYLAKGWLGLLLRFGRAGNADAT